MSAWVATAPGKVVLLGEYAVLAGAPALVLAVDRRCRVELKLCGADDCRIEAPQLDIAPVRFGLDERGQPRWPEDLPATFARTAALIDDVLGHVRALGGRATPFRMLVDTSELFESDGTRSVKLGLGSSAATAVAIDAALRAAFAGGDGSEAESETVARLLVPGRRAQGNAGSGIDLAASLCGGVIGYRIAGEHVEIKRMTLPESITTCFIWAGEPASTTDLLAAWHRAREVSPRAHGRLLGEMQAVAGAGLEAVERGDAPQILARWSNDLVGCEVVTTEHRIATGLAELLGGVFKPCGAGGGDLGMAASLEAPFRSRMQYLCRQAGLSVLPIGQANRGVHVTRE